MACLFPFGVRNKKPMSQRDTWFNVPCGSCPDCLQSHSNKWLVRLLEEDKISEVSYFVTLTYSEDTVPVSHNGLRTLQKSDFQKFVKRLRKLTPPGLKVCYYCAGEYGDKFKRPHYHAIIFNASERSIRKAWELSLETIGDVDVAPCTPATMAYTLKYLHKGRKIPAFNGDDRLPEFSLMSKGLGKSYLSPEMVAYHHADKTRFYATLPGGVKVALPRYYKNAIYNEKDRDAFAKLIAKTSDFAEAKRFLDSGLTPDQYRIEKFERKKASIKNFKNNSQR